MSRLLSLPVVAILVAALGALVYVSEPTWYQRVRFPLEYEEIIRGHARNYDLDPALVAAVIYQESRFDPNARSPSGAVGLMQLLPATAKGIAARTGGSRFVVDDLLNPELNVRYGAWYLRHLLDKYDDERLALAAYNAGQTNVDRWRSRRQEIQFAETREYVRRVLDVREVYADAYAAELGAAP